VPFTQLQANLGAGTLPDFAWIGPNLCHSAHDCSLKQADAWLAGLVPQILQSDAWKQDGLLIVVFDEGETSKGFDGVFGGRVAFVIASPLGPFGYRSSIPYTHYSLLRTLEQAWEWGTPATRATRPPAACSTCSRPPPAEPHS
jgi:hypothetical protein